MGTDVFALLTEWEPIVADFRTARNLDFYWDAGDDDLPYAVRRDFRGGRLFTHAGWYCEFQRPLLPVEHSTPLWAYLEMVYGDEPRDDLSADARRRHDSCVLYAMRPATVRLAHERAEAVPWDTLFGVAEMIAVPEMAGDRSVSTFDTAWIAITAQRRWLAEAIELRRGIVAVISQ